MDDVCVYVLSQWCNAKDIRDLDTAVCSNQTRQQFLINLQQSPLDINGMKCSKFKNWLDLRQVKIQAEAFFKTHSIECSMDSSSIVEIRTNNFSSNYWSNHFTAEIARVLNLCTGLRSINTLSEILDDTSFSQIHDCIIAGLTHVKMRCEDQPHHMFTSMSLMRMGYVCKSLVFLHLTFAHKQVFECDLRLLFQNNPNLEDVYICFAQNLGPPTFKTRDLYRVLDDSCLKLKSVELINVCPQLPVDDNFDSDEDEDDKDDEMSFDDEYYYV
jgi:hypothetical protein